MNNTKEWFKNAGWGICTHYLAQSSQMSAEKWNEQVDSFDIPKFIEQLKKTNASYYLLTIGQNSGHYCSPNKTYDDYVQTKESKCSKRDLVLELAVALKKENIKLLVYLPSGAPCLDAVAVEKLEWEWGYQVGWPNYGKRTMKRLSSFQIKWQNVIKEWSNRWGDLVSGWWIDGCYFADEMYNHSDSPNFQSFISSMKSGNDEAIVTFNSGVLPHPIVVTNLQDYTAGELNDVFPVVHNKDENCIYHLFSFLGENWGSGKPRFSDDFVSGYTKDCISMGAVVTWDVPIEKNGFIKDEFISQLKKI